MPLPEQLLLSDLLSRRVRCDRGHEHGVGQLGWMHPPVHRLLGWASRPSALATRRCIWRLDQLRGLTEADVLVQGEPAETDAATLERLPTLLGAVLLSGSGEPLGRLADAAVELNSGRIRHYLVARSDPRLPGGSRWRLSPDRIVDQRPGEVSTALQGLADLPLAQASLRETLLRRSRRWRDQWDEETSRLRDQWQQASGRFEQRLEGWLEEPPWEESPRQSREPRLDEDIWPERQDNGWSPAAADAEAQPLSRRHSREAPPAADPDPGDDRADVWNPGQEDSGAPWTEQSDPEREPWDAFDADHEASWGDAPDRPQSRSIPLQARPGRPPRAPEPQDDPWV